MRLFILSFVLFPLSVLAQPYDGPVNEAAIDAYNNEPISAYAAESDFVRLGRSVGLLMVETDRGMSRCTGFLVSSRHVMTNWHCGPGLLEDPATGVSEIRRIDFLLGYVEPGQIERAKSHAVAPVAVDGSAALDFAVFQISGAPIEEVPALPLAGRPISDATPFWIIGHPRGMSQHISREGCRAGRPVMTETGDRLQHTCDTLEGNSGSPIIDASARVVVGIHAAGHARIGVNYGVTMEEILRQSALLRQFDRTAPALGLAVLPTAVGVGDELSLKAEVPPSCAPLFVDLGPDGRATPIPEEVFERTAAQTGRMRYEITSETRYGLVIQESDVPGVHHLGYLCGLSADSRQGEALRQTLASVREAIAGGTLEGTVSVGGSQIAFAFRDYEIRR